MATGGEMVPHADALYYHTAGDALKSAQSADVGAGSADEKEFRRKQNVVTCLVFSALCLEAFANRLMAESDANLSEIRKDSLREKWLKLPGRFGAREGFDENAEPFRTFVELLDIRNERLVHFKSLGETHSTERPPPRVPYWGELVGDEQRAEKCFRAVTGMIEKLNSLTGCTALPAYLDGARYVSEVSSWDSIPWESSRGGD